MQQLMQCTRTEIKLIKFTTSTFQVCQLSHEINKTTYNLNHRPIALNRHSILFRH